MAIASLIVSIIGIFISLIPFANVFTVIIPIFAIVLGCLSHHFTEHKVMSVITIILGAVGIVVTVAVNVGIVKLIS